MTDNTTMMIRLINGTDIIANVQFTTDSTYILNEPMEFEFTEEKGEDQLYIRHYLPIKMIKQNSVEIDSFNVLFSIIPDDEFTEFYINTVSKLKDLFSLRDSITSTESYDDELKQSVIDAFKDWDTTDQTTQ